ncbi:MAG TPA: DUF302 domain-containing protein [Jatrophihabitans sp.]|nr:DUF302 domain-containing protein [Jatrophihabitans sp.]
MTEYALSVTTDTGYADTVDRARAALAEQGFGVLTEIDIAATMKAKLDLDLPPQVILGACNPPLAAQALAAEPSVGVLLPCNVVVRSLADGRTLVEAMNPAIMGQLSANPALADVAGQALARITAALESLGAGPA